MERPRGLNLRPLLLPLCAEGRSVLGEVVL